MRNKPIRRQVDLSGRYSQYDEAVAHLTGKTALTDRSSTPLPPKLFLYEGKKAVVTPSCQGKRRVLLQPVQAKEAIDFFRRAKGDGVSDLKSQERDEGQVAHPLGIRNTSNVPTYYHKIIVQLISTTNHR